LEAPSTSQAEALRAFRRDYAFATPVVIASLQQAIATVPLARGWVGEWEGLKFGGMPGIAWDTVVAAVRGRSVHAAAIRGRLEFGNGSMDRDSLRMQYEVVLLLHKCASCPGAWRVERTAFEVAWARATDSLRGRTRRLGRTFQECPPAAPQSNARGS
jgi:hypothetical protein